MTDATTFTPQPSDLCERVAEFFCTPIRFDPLGIVSGFRAYRIYSYLAGKSDAELARMGMEREKIVRVAMDTALGARQR
jgi:hypothetical protein